MRSLEIFLEVAETGSFTEAGKHLGLTQSAISQTISQLERERVLEAVSLSQTKYCAVSAMLAPAVPIRYKIILNGESIGTGEAHFSNPENKEANL